MLYVRPLMRLPFEEAGLPIGTETVVFCEDDGCPITVDEPVVDGVLKANLALVDLLRGRTHSLPGGIAFAEHVESLGVDLDVREFCMEQYLMRDVCPLVHRQNIFRLANLEFRFGVSLRCAEFRGLSRDKRSYFRF